MLQSVWLYLEFFCVINHFIVTTVYHPMSPLSILSIQTGTGSGTGWSGGKGESQAAFHVGPGWAPVGQSWDPNGPRMGLTGAHLGMLLGMYVRGAGGAGGG